MTCFSRPRPGGCSVASALARENQVSSARAARPRSLSRDVAVASRVQEDAWSRAVEWGKVPSADPSPPEPSSSSLPSRRRSQVSDPPSQPTPPASRAAIAQVSRVESPLASGSGCASPSSASSSSSCSASSSSSSSSSTTSAPVDGVMEGHVFPEAPYGLAKLINLTHTPSADEATGEDIVVILGKSAV